MVSYIAKHSEISNLSSEADTYEPKILFVSDKCYTSAILNANFHTKHFAQQPAAAEQARHKFFILFVTYLLCDRTVYCPLILCISFVLILREYLRITAIVE